MTTQLSSGDQVSFTCHILGHVKGKISHFIQDISNGQQHAVVELDLPLPKGCLVMEPTINLRKLS